MRLSLCLALISAAPACAKDGFGGQGAADRPQLHQSPGGLFYWSEPPEDYQQTLVDQYCIDADTSKAMAKALERPEGGDYGNHGTACYLSCVLRTANSWAGPIGRFSLTLDKGDRGNAISLCANGVRKTGPTTFVIGKTDYTPGRDLEVLVVQPMPEEWRAARRALRALLAG